MLCLAAPRLDGVEEYDLMMSEDLANGLVGNETPQNVTYAFPIVFA